MGYGRCCYVNRAAELDWTASFSFPVLLMALAGGWAGGGHHTHFTGAALGLACMETLSSPLTTNHCQCCPNTCAWEHPRFYTRQLTNSSGLRYQQLQRASCSDRPHGPVHIQCAYHRHLL